MGAPAWSLRRASEGDRALLFDLNRETMREYVEAVWGWDEESQRRRFDERFRPDENLQIVEVDDRPVGMVHVVERGDDLLLVNIRVLPEWQSRGIGSSVLRSVIERAARAGKPVSLKVLKVNVRARRLYARLGFEAEGETEFHLWMKHRVS